MDVYDTRYANFRALVEAEGGVSAMARKLNRAQAQVSHIGGSTRHKPIGHTLARDLESALGLPRGWLDSPQENFAPDERTRITSQQVRPDPDILHAALTLLVYDEDETLGGGPYRPREQAVRLVELYEWVARDGGRLSPASNAQFLAQVEDRRRQKGRTGNGTGSSDEQRKAG